MQKEPIPSDQFQRVTDELSKLNLLVEEIARSLNTAANINTFKATRALEQATIRIEEAGVWISKALKAMEAA